MDDLGRYDTEVIGSGSPLLFLPAGGFSGNEGLTLAEALADDFEVHLLDLPGFGRSEGLKGRVTSLELADWVNGYIVEAGLGLVHVSGHSLGGAVALAFAAHYPEKLERLVLLDAGHKPFPRVPLQEYGAFGLVVPLLNVIYRILGPAAVRKIEAKFITDKAAEPISEEQFKAFCTQTGLPERDEVCRALDAPAKLGPGGMNLLFGYYNLDMSRLMSMLRVPTLLVYADFIGVDTKEAELTKSAVASLQQDRLPVTFQSVPGGHFVHWSPEFPLERVRQFLLSTQGASSYEA
ncbi:hypothetical protein A6395_01075 [Exiguobacterium sp. SH31]|nr:hypothetical protein A6395_01075 [Exiguobacterium sp. SH31]